jgi:hypothetical protein
MAGFQLRQRQVHLDFHTGPAIPDVAADFDARRFARVMKEAHVNSCTVFAKCHHGHLYFPTKHPARHPHLKRGLDLTGRQVEALHREGIRAPIYISVLWDEFAANANPGWVAKGTDGASLGGKPLEAGWQYMDMAGPYQDYLAGQVAEILERYKPVDGIFFDICFNVESVSAHAVAGMQAAGLDPALPEDRAAFSRQVSLGYMKRFRRMVLRSSPKASVYFNSRPMSGLPDDAPLMTHVEIEALPTGGWGYMYFPKNVRYVRTFGKPYMGMTARFHKSWADFGGLKPRAALLYEVCQMLAHGAACSIGDQLHPRGRLDRAAYELIGGVYAHAEACEPWTDGARPVTQIGLFLAGRPGYYEEPGGPNDGATRMLTHLKHQFDVVGAESKLERYDLLILPDAVRVDGALAGRLRGCVKAGGRLLLSGTSGLDERLRPLLPEMGVSVAGESPFRTTYVRFGREIARGVARTDHVMYERGLRIKPARGAQALARVVEPYFERAYDHFSSHAQTPSRPEASPWAAAVRKGGVVTIAYPIFRAFGTHANLPCRQLVGTCIRLLIGRPLLEVEGPSTLEATVTRQGRRTVVHVLQFVADRRTSLDICEDIVPLRDVPLSLALSRWPGRVYLAPSGREVEFNWADGRASLTVPVVEGHQMVVFE